MICLPDTFAGPDMVIAGVIDGAGPEPALKVLCVKRVKNLGDKELAHALKTTDLSMTYRRKGGQEIGTHSRETKIIMEWHAENKGAVRRILLCTDCSQEQAGTAEVTVWTLSNPLHLENVSVWGVVSANDKDG